MSKGPGVGHTVTPDPSGRVREAQNLGASLRPSLRAQRGGSVVGRSQMGDEAGRARALGPWGWVLLPGWLPGGGARPVVMSRQC